MRPTREDTHLRSVLVPMLVALLIGFLLLVAFFIWFLGGLIR